MSWLIFDVTYGSCFIGMSDARIFFHSYLIGLNDYYTDLSNQHWDYSDELIDSLVQLDDSSMQIILFCVKMHFQSFWMFGLPDLSDLFLKEDLKYEFCYWFYCPYHVMCHSDEMNLNLYFIFRWYWIALWIWRKSFIWIHFYEGNTFLVVMP